MGIKVYATITTGKFPTVFAVGGFSLCHTVSMLEDLQLMQIIEAFLRENISSDYVDNIYRHSPPADSDDPYIIVGIAGSDEDRVEITGGNSYTVQAQITILTTNYDFSTPQLRDSIERLYTTTHHVRVALESSNYLEYVRNTVRIIGVYC